jgi:hypothetical protein
MAGLLAYIAVGVAAGLLWLAGLRLFLQSDLSRARKSGWAVFLLLVGIGIGILLPLEQIWSKFVLLLMILPVLAFIDVVLLRSSRGFIFWVRACGFEVCTVFGAAVTVRYLLDLTGATALLLSGM